MTTRTLIAATLAAALLAGVAAISPAQAVEEHHPEAEAAAEAMPQTPARPGAGMMGMMGPGMMGPGMMMPGMMGMGHGMLRMVFILMDTEGDGTLSLEEFQAAHERIFNAIDADDDGRVTLEELQAFVRGTATPAQQMPAQMREGMPMHAAPDAASQAYMDAMDVMMQRMATMEMTGDPDRDFAVMMIPHHQSAIDMAEAFLQYGDDPELTELANAIISAQQEEIEFLQQWLRESH